MITVISFVDNHHSINHQSYVPLHMLLKLRYTPQTGDINTIFDEMKEGWIED